MADSDHLQQQQQLDSSNSGNRKLKIMCSFGGKVVPRPTDNVLRYVGGHTRIITFRKDVTFDELMSKVTESAGGPVVFKYQLPDEDLDALVSVSCPEDLDNMLEEYDKLAASSDGSAKLRAFLFPPLDSNSVDGSEDSVSRYIDAVNSSSADLLPSALLRRKDSGASAASSTQNSDSVVDGVCEGTSPRGAVSMNPTDSSSSAVAQSMPMLVPMPTYIDPSQVQFLTTTQPLGVAGAMTNPAPVYVSVNPHMAPAHVTAASPVAAPVHVNTASPAGPTGVKPVPTGMGTFGEENPFAATRVVTQIPTDHGYKPAYQPLTQLPSLPSSYITQPQQNVDQLRYEFVQVPPPTGPPQPPLKIEECHLCQKALPHAHSDMLVQENSKGSSGNSAEVAPVFYSLHSDGQNQSKPVSGAIQDGLLDPKVENMTTVSDLVNYGLGKPPDVQQAVPRTENFDLAASLHPSAAAGFTGLLNVPKVENFDQAKVVLQSTPLMGFPVEVQARPKAETYNRVIGVNTPTALGITSEVPTHPKAEKYSHVVGVNPSATSGFQGDISTIYGLLQGNAPQPNIDGPLSQQQLQQPIGLPQHHVKPDVIAKPQFADISSVRNMKDPAIQDSILGLSYDNVNPIDVMMAKLQVNPAEPSGLEQVKVAVRPILTSPKDLIPDRPALVMENGCTAGQKVSGNAIYAGNPLGHPGVDSDVNHVRPLDQVPPASVDVSCLQNLQPVATTQAPITMLNQGLYNKNLDTMPEPPVPKEWLLPTHTRGLDFPHSHNAANKFPVDNKKVEASLLHTNNMPNPIAPPASTKSSAQSPNISCPTSNVELLQESSDSLFSISDPWSIVGGANVLPSKPTRVASTESLSSKDSGCENNLANSNGNVVSTLEGGEFNQPKSGQSMTLLEPVQPAKVEELVKHDIQALAEDVAASVLQPAAPPVPIFFAHERKEKETVLEANKEREINEEKINSRSAAAIVDRRVEDIKSRHTDKVNIGLPPKEGIGHLQIIKNSDLEELCELGSGTFGTVYHGKWRGSDVAIKRINDRCFAGKPSEQDRMRADFWNEACKLADLHHPNVVAFYGVVLDGPGGSFATVTEYMVNGSLKSALQRNDKTLDKRKRLIIAMDVAFGMEYLHGKNIVHFDLKSDNLLVNLRDPHRPICKVGDLGLSKVKCQTLISGGVRGTLPWMAPELLNGSSSLVSEKVDVFSYGIVMWELLTGDEPYADLHYGAIIGGIVNNTLRPPVPENCEPEWRALMEQCWSSEPSERPSFTDIANRLRSMAASLHKKNTANYGANQHAQSK